MKIAVLGAAGQLGHDLCKILPGDVIPLTRPDVDLTNKESVEHLRRVQPDVVINCAAYNLVDRAETEPAAAFAVNAIGVRDLAIICQELDCLLVHFSTDYVFGIDEKRDQPYLENVVPGPISAYGASKLAGEYFVRAHCPQHLVIRTCGLYGHHGIGGKGGNFVETMIRLAQQGKPIRVVNDQRCTPTSTEDLSATTVRLLQARRTGLYHVTNADSCTWYEFAQAIFDHLDLKVNLTPITSAEFGAAARRPRYSALGTIHDEAIGVERRTWREALAEYLENRAANS